MVVSLRTGIVDLFATNFSPANESVKRLKSMEEYHFIWYR